MRQMDKRKLIDLCKEGDEQALSLLYETYSDKLMKICLRYVSDKQIAQDLLHDAFIIIFTSIETLRHPDKLESWMGMIMKNISLRYLNQHNAISIASLSDIEEWEEPTDTFSTDCFPPYSKLLTAIEKLPDGYRKVFKLAVLEGLSHKEIGSLLGIAPHSSSSQLFRAKEMLRKFIIRYSLVLILLLLFISPIGIWFNTKKESIKENKEVKLKKGTYKQDAETLPKDSTESTLLPMNSIQYAQLKSDAVMVEHDVVSANSATKVEITQLKDTTKLKDKHISEREIKNMPSTSNIYYQPYKKVNWTLTLSYIYGEEYSKTLHSTIPSDISSGIQEEIEEKVHHHMPISFSFAIHKQLNERWGMETGISYTHLRTDFTSMKSTSTESIQRINYIGIPIKGIIQIGKFGNMSLYTSAGISLDIPIKATLEETRVEIGWTTVKKQVINAPLQWSTNFGLGFQYNISPSVGIYAEPNLQYYFSNGRKLNTIRKEQPLDISLPIGIRFSW